MNKERHVSVRAFAKQINVAESAVRRAIKEDKLKGVYILSTKKIDAVKAKKNAWVQQQSVIKPKAGVSRAKAIEKIERSNKKSDVVDDLPDPETADAEDIIKSIKIERDMPINTAMRLREIVGLAMDKIKLQKEQSVLVEKAEVETVLFAHGNELKRGLLDIPKRVIRDIMVAPNEVEATNILTDELNRVLLQFSEPKNFE